jgi:murein DD-endopeptidase MepM/ murein hydrolase activator NlpD
MSSHKPKQSIQSNNFGMQSAPQNETQTYANKYKDIYNSPLKRKGAPIPQNVSPIPPKNNTNVIPSTNISAGKYNYGSLGTITTPYQGSTRYESTHPGIDIANKIGTNIPSTVSGKVTDVVTGKTQGAPGYGNYVIITDAQGNQHRYSHLTGAYVQVGQNVSQGSTIGTMGNTGQTYSLHGGTGSHLDYRIKDMYGKYINPYNFIAV